MSQPRARNRSNALIKRFARPAGASPRRRFISNSVSYTDAVLCESIDLSTSSSLKLSHLRGFGYLPEHGTCLWDGRVGLWPNRVADLRKLRLRI